MSRSALLLFAACLNLVLAVPGPAQTAPVANALENTANGTIDWTTERFMQRASVRPLPGTQMLRRPVQWRSEPPLLLPSETCWKQ